MPSTREAARALQTGLTKVLEGCKLTAYQDGGGVWTIGYGHTAGVTPDMVITQDQADAFLVNDSTTFAARVDLTCGLGAMAALENHQRATLYDFAFNLGVDPAWTIWADVRAGRVADVPAQIRRFVYEHKNGKLVEVPGLEHRREAEVIFWNTADVAVAAAVTTTANAVPAPPSSYTRAVVTPPAPVAPPPADKVSLVAKVVTGVGGTAVAVGSQAQQIHGIISPFVDSAQIWKTIDTVAVGGIIIGSVAGLLVHEYQVRQRKT